MELYQLILVLLFEVAVAAIGYYLCAKIDPIGGVSGPRYGVLLVVWFLGTMFELFFLAPIVCFFFETNKVSTISFEDKNLGIVIFNAVELNILAAVCWIIKDQLNLKRVKDTEEK